MKLSDYFKKKDILRDGEFKRTQLIHSQTEDSICYCISPGIIETGNSNPNISCIITQKHLSDLVSPLKGVVLSDDPKKSFCELHNSLFIAGYLAPFIEFSIHHSAKIHPNAIVSSECYIGRDVVIDAGAVVQKYAYINDRCYIGPNVVIGADGLEYNYFNETNIRIHHAGGVWLGEGVDVLAGAVVSRSVYSPFTMVGNNTKISIQVNVGHECTVGERCLIAGKVQISGSSVIEDDVWIGPAATISSGVTIQKGARVEIGSVVIRDVKALQKVSGNFAYSHQKNLIDFVKRSK